MWGDDWMKYAAISLLFLLNQELISLLALNILVCMLLFDCVKERFF